MADDDFSGDDEEMEMSDMIPPEVNTILSPLRKFKNVIKGRRRLSKAKDNGEQSDGINSERRVRDKPNGSEKKR